MRLRSITWTLIAIVLLALGAGGVYYRILVWPHRNFVSVIENPSSTDEEIRDSIHQLIRWQPSHDGFIHLKEIGSDASIPLLIRNLRRIPEDEIEAEAISCTWGHCQEALVALTGQDFGLDANKWQAWHEKNQSEQASAGNP